MLVPDGGFSIDEPNHVASLISTYYAKTCDWRYSN